ncbi:MAG: sugar transferase [Cyanobacterium sp. T60_A2020_053]|nr:sugar transferase [Cyanobacterium sp. T60_A2020_053]
MRYLNSSMETDFCSDNPTDEVHPSVYSKLKRLIDVLGALVGLSITSIVFIPLAILIKLDSTGPIFFHQKRCGLKGEVFTITKFRSMTVDAEKKRHLVSNQAKGHIFKNHQDPRITKVGKIIRSCSLDEFPQFWNVLKGDMSLVGTRPPTPQEVSYYNSYHLLRLNVKPGLTGEWQVKGRSHILDFEEIVALDLEYQRKWSVKYDLILILKTIAVVLKKTGAV